VRLTDKGDRRAAFPLLARAARAGIAEAEFRVGRCYLEGGGVPPSRGDGVRWLEKAAAQGYVEAQALLATLCLNGLGPEQAAPCCLAGPVPPGPDFETSLYWAKRAAEGGSAEGQAVMGFILGSGPEAVRDQAGLRRMVQAVGRGGMSARAARLRSRSGRGTPAIPRFRPS
jgi:TPR repeat protein